MSQGIFGVGDNDFETKDSAFDLFSKPVLNDDYYTFNDFTYKPKNPIQNSEHNPIIFEIGSDDSRNYSLLHTIRIDGQIKVLHSDGTNLVTDEEVSVTNLLPHSLFQSIDVKINGQPVSDHARLYPHRAYIHSLYSYSKESKEHTQLSEYYLEEETADESVVETSTGFTQRANLIDESRICYISFEPKIDTLTVNRYFPPGHTISFEFIRAPAHFTLLAPSSNTKSYKIEILDLSLTCRQILPTEQVESKMRKLLSVKDVHLPVTRLVARTRSLHAGLYDGTIYNAIMGRMPSHLMVFFLKNSQLNANLTSNPFHLGKHELIEASLIVNGQTFPSEKLSFNSLSGDYFKSYRFAMSNIGCTGDMSTGVTPNRYIKDCFALAFDLTPDSCLNNHLHNSIDANIDIKLRFGKALDTPLTVLYISTYDNVITLSPDKSVALDYTV